MFSPSTWPSDSSALARYGYSEIQLLATHFEVPLKTRNYDPDAYFNEWAKMKLLTQELLQVNRKRKYLALWQRILNESELNNLLNILGLVKIILPSYTCSNSHLRERLFFNEKN